MKKLVLTFISLCLMASVVAIPSPTTLTVSSTAGGLSSAIKTAGGSLTTVTTLTITGTIDARDFKMMRDSLPLLEILDIENTTISQYVGLYGTLNSSTTYPANEIPERSFSYSYTNIVSNLKTVKCPNTITSIGLMAFSACENLLTVNLPNTLTDIENSAFEACFKMQTLFIPASVSFISSSAFRNCSTSFNVDAANPYFSSFEGVLFNKTQTKIIKYPSKITGSYVVPSTVNTIGFNAFTYCSLSSIELPSSVTTIEGGAFYGSSKISSFKVNSTNPVNLSGTINVFDGSSSQTATLYVPTGSRLTYKNASVWGGYFGTVTEFNVSATFNAISSNIKINTTNGKAELSNLPLGESLTVYNLQGVAIYNQKATEETISVNLPARGMYIVKVGSQSLKVIN